MFILFPLKKYVWPAKTYFIHFFRIFRRQTAWLKLWLRAWLIDVWLSLIHLLHICQSPLCFTYGKVSASKKHESYCADIVQLIITCAGLLMLQECFGFTVLSQTNYRENPTISKASDSVHMLYPGHAQVLLLSNPQEKVASLGLCGNITQ